MRGSVNGQRQYGVFRHSSFILFSIGCLFAVGSACSLPVDWRVAGSVQQFDLPGDLSKAVNLSEAFAHGLGAAAILGCVLVVAVERRKAVLFAILITAISGLTANAMKACVVRDRPYYHLQKLTENNPDSATEESEQLDFWDSRQRSFPSGHTATAWGLAIGLSCVFPRGILLFGILACLASFQRLTANAHYLSDVLAGAGVAFGCAVILLTIPYSRRLLDP